MFQAALLIILLIKFRDNVFKLVQIINLVNLPIEFVRIFALLENMGIKAVNSVLLFALMDILVTPWQVSALYNVLKDSLVNQLINYVLRLVLLGHLETVWLDSVWILVQTGILVIHLQIFALNFALHLSMEIRRHNVVRASVRKDILETI